MKKNPKVSKYIQSLKVLAPLNDDMVNEIVLREINSVEPKYRGVLINGYPRTLVFFLFFQRIYLFKKATSFVYARKRGNS